MKTNRKNEENKRNNKGFSLVELIVVIAIMAVLVAVLAPQFTKYVDRSRQSVDAQTVSGIVTAVQIGCADVTDYEIKDDTYTITVATDGTTVTSADNADNAAEVEKAITDSCGARTDLKETSKAFKDGIEIEIKVENGVPTVDYKTEAFKNYITNNGSDADSNSNSGGNNNNEENI